VKAEAKILASYGYCDWNSSNVVKSNSDGLYYFIDTEHKSIEDLLYNILDIALEKQLLTKEERKFFMIHQRYWAHNMYNELKAVGKNQNIFNITV